MFTNVQSIEEFKRSITKKVVQHNIIHLNNMHGIKHTTEFICLRLFIFMN